MQMVEERNASQWPSLTFGTPRIDALPPADRAIFSPPRGTNVGQVQRQPRMESSKRLERYATAMKIQMSPG